MKKILALILVFTMFPMTNVLAADTPHTESSTDIQGNTNESGEPHYDSLEEMYDAYRAMDDDEWTEKMGNKDLCGEDCQENGGVKLTGLFNQLFIDAENMVPGDSVTKYMRIKNTSNIDYHLYLEAERKKCPGENEVDLFNVLNLNITKTGDTLEDPVYSGHVFDQNTAIHNGSQDQRIDLGTIKSGQEPVILKATVTMDLNAGKEYQNKSEEVNWIFTTEGDIEPSPNPDPNPKPNPDPNPDSNPSPSSGKFFGGIGASQSGKGGYKGILSKTGDSNSIIIYALLACGSLLIGYVLFSKGKKNGKGHEK